jgi:hypothetical protein
MEVLIKAVIQAVPTYNMCIFQLRKRLCNTLNAMISRFWWGHQHNTHKTAWAKWNILGASKRSGGMGFHDLKIFNLALLAKQGWRLINNPDSLVAQVQREKYFPTGSFLTAQLGRSPSLAWGSLYRAKVVLEGGLRWRVGNRDSIKIWGDKWLPSPSTYQVQSPVQVLDQEARVSSLIDSGRGWWDVGLIRSMIQLKEAEVIWELFLSPLSQHNKFIWGGGLNRGATL